jgi:hypothetical protein
MTYEKKPGSISFAPNLLSLRSKIEALCFPLSALSISLRSRFEKGANQESDDMTTLLPASLQNSLQEIVQRSNQRAAFIRAILLSTTDGVPLGRVIAPTTPDSASAATGTAGDGAADSTAGAELSTLQEDGLASIESVWAPASKQFPVLGLDKVHQVTAIYDHGTLVHIYQAPLVSLFVATCAGAGALDILVQR